MTTREKLEDFLDGKYRDAKRWEEISDVEEFLLDKIGGVFSFWLHGKGEPEGDILFESIDFSSSDSVRSYHMFLGYILDNCSGNIHIGENVVKVVPREILSVITEKPAGKEIGKDIGIIFSLDQEKSDLEGLELKVEEIQSRPFYFSRREFLSRYGGGEEGDFAVLFDNFYEFLSLSEDGIEE